MAKSFFVCILMSMAPVVELRGALPYGISKALPILPLYIACVLGNMFPVPFIILFVRKLLSWMQSNGYMEGIVRRIEHHAQKNIQIYYRYKLLGLFILVAIPLPGTGAWTGALVASLLGLCLKHAVPAIAAGVATAGLFMLWISFGIVTVIGMA